MSNTFLVLKSLLDLQNDISHAYRAALQNLFLWAMAVSIPLHKVFMPATLYFGHNLGNKSMNFSCLICGFVGMDREYVPYCFESQSQGVILKLI